VVWHESVFGGVLGSPPEANVLQNMIVLYMKLNNRITKVPL